MGNGSRYGGARTKSSLLGTEQVCAWPDLEPVADMGVPLSGLLVASKQAQFTPAVTASTV
jgi:hypothetical protein